MEDGDAPFQLVGQGVQHRLGLVCDDIGHLGGVQAIEHRVHDYGGDIQGHQAVQGGVQTVEHQGGGADHRQIQPQQQPAHGQPGQRQLQQPGQQVGAAGGSPLAQDDTQGDAQKQAAVDAGQQRLHGLKGVQTVQQVDEQGGHRHGVEGGHQQAASQQLPPQQEQRDVHTEYQHADGGKAQKGVDHLGYAGEPAVGDVVGGVAPVEGHRVNNAGQCNDEVTAQRFQGQGDSLLTGRNVNFSLSV